MLCGERRRASLLRGEFGRDLVDGGQFLVPTPLEHFGNEPIVRIGLVVLLKRTVRFVLALLELTPEHGASIAFGGVTVRAPRVGLSLACPAACGASTP